MVNGSARILYAAGSSFADAQVQANGMAYGLLQRHATMLAFVDDFWMMGLTFLIFDPPDVFDEEEPAARSASEARIERAGMYPRSAPPGRQRFDRSYQAGSGLSGIHRIV